MRRKDNGLSPERQRKLDLIAEAVQKRGYTVWDYRGGLYPGGKGWTVMIQATAQAPERGPYSELSLETFEELLQTFDDDLAWAQYMHRRIGEPLREFLGQARSAYFRAAGSYGSDMAAILRITIETGRVVLDDSESIVQSAMGHRDETKKLYAHYRAEQERLAEYEATMPTTAEQAATYLAGLPLRGERS